MQHRFHEIDKAKCPSPCIKRNCQLCIMKIESLVFGLGRLWVFCLFFFPLYIFRTLENFTAVEFVKKSFACFLTLSGIKGSCSTIGK